jgi:hypothetical protein
VYGRIFPRFPYHPVDHTPEGDTPMRLVMSAMTLFGLLGPPAVHAQIVLPKPAAPVLVAPASGATLPGQASGATHLQVQWNQWGVISSPQQPLPTFFVVCLKPASQASCNFAASDFQPVGSVSSTRLFNGLTLSGYQYTLALPVAGAPISDALLDVDLTLSVGACRGAGASACSFSAPRPIFLSARDLKPGNVSDGSSNATHAVYEHEFENLGTTAIPDTPLMMVKVIEWEALLNSSAQCRLDFNAADLVDNPNALLFMEDGSGRWIVDFPKKGKKRDVTGTVVGIHLWNGGFNIVSDVLPFGMSLMPGRAGSVTKSIAVSAMQRPRGYINVTWVDDTSVVREFDETNNSRAECNVVR